MDAPSGRRAADIGPEALPPLSPWWLRDPLGCGPRGLTLDGHGLADVARIHGTPVYVYSRSAVRAEVASLRAALAATGARTRLYYALKANRHPALLEVLRAEGDVGIDACSPREVDLAREMGFAPHEISVTACMPSNRDLDRFAAAGVHVNLDSLSSIRRYAERVARGTPAGLRFDCGVEVGYGSDPRFAYGNGKLGLPLAAFEEAMALAAGRGLRVTTLHVHCGWGLRMEDALQVEWVFAQLADLARRAPEVSVVNVGGGLGARRRGADAPLALEAWADALRRRLAPLGVTLACEPGTLLVDRAGVLVAEINTVERRGATTWVGVDAGENVNVYVAHYGIPIEVVHVARPLDEADASYAIGGNINESGDVFGRGVPLPRPREGDLLALLPAGAYGSSMASDHCLRGFAAETAL